MKSVGKFASSEGRDGRRFFALEFHQTLNGIWFGLMLGRRRRRVFPRGRDLNSFPVRTPGVCFYTIAAFFRTFVPHFQRLFLRRLRTTIISVFCLLIAAMTETSIVELILSVDEFELVIPSLFFFTKGSVNVVSVRNGYRALFPPPCFSPLRHSNCKCNGSNPE